MKYSNNPEYLSIGKITKAVGIKGEVRVLLYAGESDNLHKDSVLGLSMGNKEAEAKVESIRYQNGVPVIKLSNAPDRNEAEALRGYEIYIKVADLAELPEGEYYIRDLIGFDVYDENSEQTIGKVTDYLQNRAQPLWEVKTALGKQVLIPDVEAFVRNIDGEGRVVTVALIPGFLE